MLFIARLWSSTLPLRSRRLSRFIFTLSLLLLALFLSFGYFVSLADQPSDSEFQQRLVHVKALDENLYLDSKGHYSTHQASQDIS